MFFSPHMQQCLFIRTKCTKARKLSLFVRKTVGSLRLWSLQTQHFENSLDLPREFTLVGVYLENMEEVSLSSGEEDAGFLSEEEASLSLGEEKSTVYNQERRLVHHLE